MLLIVCQLYYLFYLYLSSNQLKQYNMKKVNKLVKMFLAKYETEKEFLDDERFESDKIELDNLDWARLVAEPNHDGLGSIIIIVENEHGSLFDVSELSSIEIDIFMANI